MSLNSVGFFVGTYSAPQSAQDYAGEGIYHCNLNLKSGAISTPVCVAECLNPSYLAWGRDRKNIYAVREVLGKNHPAILSFEALKEGALRPVNIRPVVGELPCHLSLDASGRYLASAQYLRGHVSIFQIEGDGGVGDTLGTIQHQGSGPNSARQESPHAHFAWFLSEPDELAVVDLGLDQVIFYPFDMSNGYANQKKPNKTQLPGGVGPRHLAWLEGANYLYVYCEMRALVFVFKRDRTNWIKVQMLHIYGEPAGKLDAGAAIKLSPDGRFLYVSERNQSQIVCFSIEQESGEITPVQQIFTGGTGPRDFSLSPDGQFIVVANQVSNSLVSYFRNPHNGRLRATGQVTNVGSPVCILF